MMVESKARMRDEVYPYADRPNVSAEEIGRWQRDMGLRFNVGDDEFIADVNGVYRVEKTA